MRRFYEVQKPSSEIDFSRTEFYRLLRQKTEEFKGKSPELPRLFSRNPYRQLNNLLGAIGYCRKTSDINVPPICFAVLFSTILDLYPPEFIEALSNEIIPGEYSGFYTFENKEVTFFEVQNNNLSSPIFNIEMMNQFLNLLEEEVRTQRQSPLKITVLSFDYVNDQMKFKVCKKLLVDFLCQQMIFPALSPDRPKIQFLKPMSDFFKKYLREGKLSEDDLLKNLSEIFGKISEGMKNYLSWRNSGDPENEPKWNALKADILDCNL